MVSFALLKTIECVRDLSGVGETLVTQSGALKITSPAEFTAMIETLYFPPSPSKKRALSTISTFANPGNFSARKESQDLNNEIELFSLIAE
jgi:hypothetical protein